MEDDALKRVFAWLATAATLTFASIGAADQNDPRLADLFDRLKTAPSSETAETIEREIWQIWLASGDESIDRIMAKGVRAMALRDFGQALAAFDTVTEQAPDFAEGWNKRATLHYLVGNFRESIADIDRTLALEPRHFGALSGLGLVWLSLGDEEKALDAFERALAVHPRLSGAETHIKALRDKLKGRRI